MTVGCQIQCKEGLFSPHGLFDCERDSLLCRLSRTSGDVSPKPEAGAGRGVCPAARGIGAGEGGSLLPGATLGTPPCRARRRGSGAGAGRAAGARWDGVRDQSPPGSPDPTGREGAQRGVPPPRVSHGEGAPQIRVSQGPGCAEMLRRRDVPGATDTGWHCSKVWAQRWGHGLGVPQDSSGIGVVVSL